MPDLWQTSMTVLRAIQLQTWEMTYSRSCLQHPETASLIQRLYQVRESKVRTLMSIK